MIPTFREKLVPFKGTDTVAWANKRMFHTNRKWKKKKEDEWENCTVKKKTLTLTKHWNWSVNKWLVGQTVLPEIRKYYHFSVFTLSVNEEIKDWSNAIGTGTNGTWLTTTLGRNQTHLYWQWVQMQPCYFYLPRNSESQALSLLVHPGFTKVP